LSLNKQKFSLSFFQGVDTKSDDKQVIPTKLLTLENGVLTKTGKVIKRNGYNQIGSTLSAGAALTNYQEELIEFDGTTAYSYSENQDSWINKGALNTLNIHSNPVIRNTYQQQNADCAIHPNGLQVFTWTDARGGVRYSCIDNSTNQIVISDALLSATAVNAKPMAIGAYIIIIYYDSANPNNISALPLSVVNPSVPGAAFDIVTDVKSASPNWDATRLGDRVFMSYNSSNAGSSVGTAYVNAFLSVSSVLYQTAITASTCIGTFADEDNQVLYIAYYNGTSVFYLTINYTLTSVTLAPTTVETVANVKNVSGYVVNGVGVIYYTITAAATYNYFIRKNSITSGGSVGTAADFCRSVSLAGKVFIHASAPYVPTVFDTTLQPTIFVLNGSAVAVAKIAPALTGGTIINAMLCNVPEVQTNSYLIPYTKKDLLESVNGNVFTQTGINSSEIVFSADNSFQEAELGNNLHTTGGLLQMYDGVNFIEHGFNYYPENFSNSINAAAGSITAGTRQYVVVYEWFDNQGQVHRSTTSVPLSVVNVGATNTNTLTIPTLRVTEKKGTRTNVQVVVYRTIAAGTIFYKVTSTTSPVFNTTTADTVTYADTTSDSTLIGNGLLYTTGGVVDNAQAEATNILTTYKNRIVYVPEDKYSYNYSKQAVNGSAVEFFDYQPTQIDRRGGEITALAQMDEKLIFFKESAIFFLSGNGPDATGNQNDFSDPILITTDGGCINQNSVVSMPLGLMYKSKKGIYLLNRGLNIEYVGKDVEAYNADTIISSKLVATKNQVRFALSDGTLLVYDYLVGQWYTFTNHNLIVDCTNFNDRFVYLRSDGIVLTENDGYTDFGNAIKMKIKTSWLSFAQMQGYQRIYAAWFIGTFKSDHQLGITVAYDFNSNSTNSVLIDTTDFINLETYGESSPYGSDTVYGGEFPYYQFEYKLPRQKCQSVQFTIEDYQSTTLGEGYDLSNIGVLLGIKKGYNKLGNSRVYG
jgi:hypothetical protein